MNWRDQVSQHVEEAAPLEACGLVVEIDGTPLFWPCRNLCDKPELFALDPEDYLQAEEAGTVLAVVHSHVSDDLAASDLDQENCDLTGVPWHIISATTGEWITIQPAFNLEEEVA